MNTKLFLKGIMIASVAFGLSNCASLQSANQVADYNGDGVISNAEYSQYQKQKNIEDRNVYTESVKRRNAVNTVRDVRDAAYFGRGTKRILNNW